MIIKYIAPDLPPDPQSHLTVENGKDTYRQPI